MIPLDLDLAAPEAVPGIRILPVVHERVDLAGVVRLVLESLQPDAVAVELPTTLKNVAEQAVARLPMMSLVVSEEPGEDALVWIVAPGDPVVEAMRWAAEHGRPAVLIDPDVHYRHRRRDVLPDPHAIHALGSGAYLDLIRRLADREPHDERDTVRERGMAHALRTAAADVGTVLCLTGAAHARRLADWLLKPTTPVVARQHRQRVTLRHLHPDSMTAVLPDPPIAHAAHEHLRGGRLPPLPVFEATLSRRIELEHGPMTVITGGGGGEHGDRTETVAARAAHQGSTVASDGSRVVDREAIGRLVWRIAAASYREQTRNPVERWQDRLYSDFVRRYTRVRGQLVPGLYEWVVGARGVADDNLAWEVFDAGRSYPWQPDEAEIPTARIDGEHLDLGTRTVRFRRRFFRVKHRPVAVPVRQRPSPAEPGEWLQAFTGDSICSYPPEDVVVEDWGRHLKQRAVSIVTAERSHSEPFVTSLLDGIDIRETLMRLHEGRIWVEERGREGGAAGSVVVIFDDDATGTGFPYMMTWLGEHEQESDMALYATDPLRQVVGPGIMRATYGGFMLTYPPGRLYDVWRDPDYAGARTKPEVLCMAGIDYSTERLVVHAAARPPSSRLREYAAAHGKRIVHIPLGALSPAALRSLRVVHILSGRDKREIAKDYVW
jgi:hypothetical protein